MSFLGLPKFLPIIGTLPLDLYSEYKCLNLLLVIPKNCAKSVCFDFPFWHCFNVHSSLLLFLSFTMNSSAWLERKFLWEKTIFHGSVQNLASARVPSGSAAYFLS